MDGYEGVRQRAYLRRFFTIHDRQGRSHDCLFYTMSATHGIMPPSEAYAEVVAQGYRDWNLPMWQLDRALAESWQDKALTPDLRARRAKSGRRSRATFGSLDLTEEDYAELLNHRRMS
jgi:hypothetical protein